MFDMNNI